MNFKSIPIAVVGFALTFNSANGENLKPQKVEFETDDGITIAADYFQSMGRAIAPPVILLHMYKSDRTAWSPLVEPLHNAGFAVLAIDLRGHGQSIKPEYKELRQKVEKRDERLFNNMHKDVAAAVKWIRTQPNVDKTKVALVGASVGCSVAIDYAGRDKTVCAVVCLTPGEKYLGIDSTRDIHEINKTPIMLLATEDEREATDTLAKLADNATAEIVGKGKTHGTMMFGVIKDIEEKIVKFLHKNSFKQ